jgi:hypothetical protein
VGPIRLRSGRKRFVEYVRGEPRSLAGVAVAESWPIIVEGAPNVDNDNAEPHQRAWSDVERAGCVALHRVCALLSLEWGEAWQVRTSPTPTENLPAEVPDAWPAPPIIRLSASESPEANPSAAPAWLRSAWDRLDADKKLAAALTSWHQGILLMPLFPSFALVAFVGCVEVLAQFDGFADAIRPAEACPTCGTMGGANARFWAALQLVSAPAEMKVLREDEKLLKKRAQTAHGSGTHGIETAFGSALLFEVQPPSTQNRLRVSIDEADPVQGFMFGLVPTVGRKARQLLLHVLAQR